MNAVLSPDYREYNLEREALNALNMIRRNGWKGIIWPGWLNSLFNKIMRLKDEN
jgi:hypothetical protein